MYNVKSTRRVYVQIFTVLNSTLVRHGPNTRGNSCMQLPPKNINQFEKK